MPILKAPPIQPKNETLQLRVSQDLKFRLLCYADFLHASASYVVGEALERLFRKDGEFQEYLATHKPPQAGDHRGKEKAPPPRDEADSYVMYVRTGRDDTSSTTHCSASSCDKESEPEQL